MRVIDLSHPISLTMPVYPGSHPPEIATASTMKDHGYRVKNMLFNSHLGTHLDAPVHMVDDGKTLDQLSVDSFIGNAVIVNISSQQASFIEVDDLYPFQQKIEECEFVIIGTGWSRFWGEETYFHKYPALTYDAALWLTRFSIKGIGLDTVSIDTDDSQDYNNHKAVLERDILIIENLTNLENIPDGRCLFSCFPQNIEGGDGCPVRAVAMIQ